jgi:hypothetical protein
LYELKLSGPAWKSPFVPVNDSVPTILKCRCDCHVTKYIDLEADYWTRPDLRKSLSNAMSPELGSYSNSVNFIRWRVISRYMRSCLCQPLLCRLNLFLYHSPVQGNFPSRLRFEPGTFRIQVKNITRLSQLTRREEEYVTCVLYMVRDILVHFRNKLLQLYRLHHSSPIPQHPPPTRWVASNPDPISLCWFPVMFKKHQSWTFHVLNSQFQVAKAKTAIIVSKTLILL